MLGEQFAAALLRPAHPATTVPLLPIIYDLRLHGGGFHPATLSPARVFDYGVPERTLTIELGVLAKKAGMSLSTFKRAFKAVTGTSPIDYVLQARLARACHLLRDADKTVTEAALAAGFNDSNYFARRFRRRMGCTPREWRGKQRAASVRGKSRSR